MRLADVLPGTGAPASDVEIGDLAYDSRRVEPGALFFCVTGFERDGHDFAPQAVERGAAALVVERPLGLGVPEARVASARAAMGPAAARFFGHPTRELALAGITGTNGKTTTAFLTHAMLEAGGRRSGLLGTVKSIAGGVERELARTTPEAIDLQRGFREMLAAGDRGCVMEVSSHALELGRTTGIEFGVAVFTNLTQDHLDFHPTMEDYFQAKRRLFAAGPAHMVVNADDPYGRRLLEEFPHARSFALEDPGADYHARDLEVSFDGCRFVLRTPAGERPASFPLPGRFNAANALAAAAAAEALGVELDVVVATLAHPPRVPGRFEPVDEGQGFAVLVDYAHTPDSLENVLRAARGLTERRVVCVFGAGGDRDRGKRPLMGEIAARLADVVLVTSDNPRSEDPAQIVEQVMDGVRRAGAEQAEALVDRREAIARAVALAQPGDVVVIAGKGHEQGQEFADGRKLPFDDVSVARDALRARDVPAGAGA